MSALLSPAFGNPEAIRSAKIGGACFSRAVQLGYSRTIAQNLARVAKREATAIETPSEVAFRVVPPRTHSATTRGPKPFGGSAA